MNRRAARGGASAVAHRWVSERVGERVPRRHRARIYIFLSGAASRGRERPGGERRRKERVVRAAAHVISNETSTCLVVEIIVAFSSLKANLRASRPRPPRRYGRITRRESESPPFSRKTTGPDVSDDERRRDEDEDRITVCFHFFFFSRPCLLNLSLIIVFDAWFICY